MKLAEAFDWHGHRCERSVDLRDTLEQAFTGTALSLVVIPIDYAENQKLTERLGTIVCPT